MTDSEGDNALKFSTFSSSLDPSFFHKLQQIKLEIDRLEEKPRSIRGQYSNLIALPQTLTVDGSSFNSEMVNGGGWTLSARGSLLNVNTIENFRDRDKAALLAEHSAEMWQHLVSGEAMKDPTLLISFLVFSYADLKNHIFYYWCAFPALPLDPGVSLLSPPSPATSTIPMETLEVIVAALYAAPDQRQRGFFSLDSNMRLAALADCAGLSANVTVGFCDPGSSDQHPGWPLRNLLALLACQCPALAEVRVLCLRLGPGWSPVSSLVLTLKLPGQSQAVSPTAPPLQWVGWERNDRGKMGPRKADLRQSMDPLRLATASVDLNLQLMKWRLLPALDLMVIKQSRCLLLGAGTLGCAVARNLLCAKRLESRVLSNIDKGNSRNIERQNLIHRGIPLHSNYQQQENVHGMILDEEKAWGVRQVTLVDSGRVSYSNPVRQSLFVHTDCADGGRPKAEAAAAAMRVIFPGAESQGVSMMVPMAGHPVGPSLVEQTRQDVERLEKLIADHDAVFLLMDSRESRWLPTLIGASQGKITMTAALGFDTFLVMRHGSRSKPIHKNPSEPGADLPEGQLPGSKLGCYFCNDVTAPGNTQHDRSLDMQCTVTRPGVSNLASALVVELFVSLLQHPLRFDAAADADPNVQTDGCALGSVPHSIRGFLARFEQLRFAQHRYPQCVACSDHVVSAYERDGFDFLLQAFNTPRFLEDVTGITESNVLAAQLEQEVWELSDLEDADSE